MSAIKFLKNLSEYNSVFDMNNNFEFSEDQLTDFAEAYHKNEFNNASEEAKKVLMTDNGQMAKEFLKNHFKL